MGKKPNLADLQTKVLVVALGSERRWKRIALFGAGLLVLGGGAVFVAVGALDTKAKETQAGAWSSLSTCLVGAPLGERETAGQRVRAIQLGILGVPREKRSKGSELPWPARCAPAAHSLAESTKTLGGDKSPLAGAAEVLAKALTDNAVAVNDMRAEVDKLWKEATAAGLKAGAAPAGVTAAPAPATFFTNEQFRELPRFLSGSFSLASVKAEQTVGERITLLVDQKDLPEGPVVCTLGATDTALKCVKVPPAAAKLSPGLRLVGTVEQGARPFLFAGDRGQLGIFPPEGGDKVAAAPALGATARADGSLWVLTRREPKDARLLLQPATGVGTERPLLSGLELESATHAGLFWDHVLYRGKTATAGAHLFARKLPPTAMGEPSPPIDVGALDEPAPADAPNEDDQLSACRSTDGIAVRVRGAKSDAIAFLAGGRWSAPVKMGHKGGTLTCRGLEAVATKVTTAMEGDKNLATIAQARCNTGGCTPASTSMKEVLGGTEAIAPSDANGVTAADVNGKLLVAWNGGYTGGVRLRVAPIERMRDGEDVVVCDARDEGSSQRLTTALEVRAIPASGFALLLVSTTSGVRALRVDQAGKLTPIGATL